jgi:hypothetical protein
LTCPAESKPNSKITKTKIIGVMLMACSSHRQKIAAARMPSRTPSNGLERANQKETRQPNSLAVGFVFTLFSQPYEDRHFTNTRNSFREANDPYIRPRRSIGRPSLPSRRRQAKERFSRLFDDNPQRLFYSTQIETSFEREFFHWITGRALLEMG